MTTYKITATRSGSYNGMDFDNEYEIEFRAEGNDVQSESDDMILHLVSVSPDAGDHGAFSDIAQKWLEYWAQDWLDGTGYDAAVALATSESDATREAT